MIILNSNLDTDGTRWIEPIAGLKLKVTSIDSPAFASASAYVQRHIDKQDANFKVGSSDFRVRELGSAAASPLIAFSVSRIFDAR